MPIERDLNRPARVSDFDRVVRARRMIRSFSEAPVDPHVLDSLCDLARRAPSAGNTSAVEFLVLDEPDAVRTYWNTTMTEAKQETFRWQGLLSAPALIVLLTTPEAYVTRYAESDKARAGLGSTIDAWPQPFWWIDAGAVAQNLLLGAVDRGLGACLFGVFDHEAAVKGRFEIPDDRRIVCTIAIGHPTDDVPDRGRSAGRPRPLLNEILRRGSWHEDRRARPGDRPESAS